MSLRYKLEREINYNKKKVYTHKLVSEDTNASNFIRLKYDMIFNSWKFGDWEIMESYDRLNKEIKFFKELNNKLESGEFQKEYSIWLLQNT